MSILNSVNISLVHHFLERNAHLRPGKEAIVTETGRANYLEIDEKANQLANWLAKHGVKKGDRVVILLENGLEYVISYYGVMKIGGIAVPLSTGLRTESLRHIVKELESRIIISSYKFEKILKASLLEKENVEHVLMHVKKVKYGGESGILASFAQVYKESCYKDIALTIEQNDIANIIYTSGSTGKPKGVMLSHKNIVHNSRSICNYLQLTEKDVQMVVIPFFYVMGQSLLNTHMAVGGKLVINNRFAFPTLVLKQMVSEGVTGFSGVPSTYAYLLHRSPIAEYKSTLESLRYCTQAGGHMSKAIKDNLLKVLPQHTQLYVMYGATEASARLTYLEPEFLKNKKDSIGKPIEGVTIRILDKNGQSVADLEPGEIVAYGPNIMQGYWKDEAATRKVLHQKGYHTGDIGYRDKDGFLFVVGRKDNMLKVGGHKINPKEIEDVILESNLIVETAVLGLSDPILGTKIVALVVPKNRDFNDKVMVSYCSEILPKYKLPTEIVAVRSLPKMSNGKIDNTKCFELLKS